MYSTVPEGCYQIVGMRKQGPTLAIYAKLGPFSRGMKNETNSEYRIYPSYSCAAARINHVHPDQTH